MKSIFNKIFTADKEDKPPVSQTLEPAVKPFQTIHENQNRALITWIENYLAFKLRTDVTNAEHPTNLAACLLAWIAQEEDVYLKAKELQLSDKVHRCLLETYEEIKHDVVLYLPSLSKSSTVQQHSADEEVWQVYRDVIYAVTQRKFLLIRQDEVERFKEGKLLCSAPIVERADIPKARDMAKQCLLDIGVPSTAVMSHLLVISEAITNILKHAREGRMLVVETESGIHVLVEDKGPGFPLKLLPKTTLLAGYSTKKSLGQGFTLMMKMTEQVLLSTIPDEGSTLILVFHRKEGELSYERSSAV
ncbi:anti-sigma regulatory factor [Cohnella pontilimi]|uniref:Anti-sigma regulatory factor n=1 Tax=Cohnella pontilimi TaxID=2564100 RepID=A0A4U0FDE8_9BACL|nr:ATP-binding protein [Cohnella pontilimi]TJY42855.1 anti-sigma regulatory factor [Cohnella pontilimi]